ncbi:uncharacterized protein J4E79_006395 [Alternaria viburni]|uniref:uncharacterized protein n=1 Tax=Alternaria viburni TaxID=566460 RepID=UPI0020C3BE58|nr:uncharacterized protein J4E79_006395 [Alternaria viburni]KAI4658637.1 hypothetical protein J4E79_006395 [Alternaria viburni]
MKNITPLLSTLITANHILSHHTVLDPFGHISVRNSNTNTTFFIALQIGPATVSSPADIGEYHIADGTPLPGTTGGYAERYIHNYAGNGKGDGDGDGDGKGMLGI